jgi:translation initiation factor IF-1
MYAGSVSVLTEDCHPNDAYIPGTQQKWLIGNDKIGVPIMIVGT